MIELSKLQALAMELGVSREVVLMEHYQLLWLSELGNRPWAKQLVFKGGTCLRLAYGSFRFSEDLDFSLLSPLAFDDFRRVVESVVKKYPELKLDEVFDMKQTLFARVMVEVGGLKVGIKLEISKRKEVWVRGKDYEAKVISSSVSHLRPVVLVATLERIWTDKLRVIESRTKPRDYFDIWFVGQLLGKQVKRKVKVSRKLMIDRVRYLLPENKRFVLDEFEYETD